jgi:hypothetical protein
LATLSPAGVVAVVPVGASFDAASLVAVNVNVLFGPAATQPVMVTF